VKLLDRWHSAGIEDELLVALVCLLLFVPLFEGEEKLVLTEVLFVGQQLNCQFFVGEI
jgi:hypothetical protein